MINARGHSLPSNFPLNFAFLPIDNGRVWCSKLFGHLLLSTVKGLGWLPPQKLPVMLKIHGFFGRKWFSLKDSLAALKSQLLFFMTLSYLQSPKIPMKSHIGTWWNGGFCRQVLRDTWHRKGSAWFNLEVKNYASWLKIRACASVERNAAEMHVYS